MSDEHLAPMSKKSQAELLEIWRGTGDEAQSERAEALWQYWYRIAEASVAVDVELFKCALDSDLATREVVVGELVRRDRLGDETLMLSRRFASSLGAGAQRLRLQLNAREAVNALREGKTLPEGLLIDSLLHSGVAWAALEALPFLDLSGRGFVLSWMESYSCFTRGQRHMIREEAARLGRQEDP